MLGFVESPQTRETWTSEPVPERRLILCAIKQSLCRRLRGRSSDSRERNCLVIIHYFESCWYSDFFNQDSDLSLRFFVSDDYLYITASTLTSFSVTPLRDISAHFWVLSNVTIKLLERFTTNLPTKVVHTLIPWHLVVNRGNKSATFIPSPYHCI